jgi:hypothetical protein
MPARKQGRRIPRAVNRVTLSAASIVRSTAASRRWCAGSAAIAVEPVCRTCVAALSHALASFYTAGSPIFEVFFGGFVAAPDVVASAAPYSYYAYRCYPYYPPYQVYWTPLDHSGSDLSPHPQSW